MTSNYFVYIMASATGTLYVWVTNNLERRVAEHKMGSAEGFSSKYGCNRLVYFENGGDVNEAIAREKQIKNFSRIKKERLIQIMNPVWEDLSQRW